MLIALESFFKLEKFCCIMGYMTAKKRKEKKRKKKRLVSKGPLDCVYCT